MSPDERLTPDQTPARDQRAGQGSAPALRHGGVAAAARWYVERGYGVFPCIARTKGPRYRKGSHPRWAPDPDSPAGLHCAAWEVDDVEAHWPNDRGIAVGLVPPVGVVIVDADEKHRPGIVKRILEAFPALAENGVHRTRSNGAHLPARIPAGVDPPQSVDPALGIDTRVGAKGYVIAPPAPGYEIRTRFRAVEDLTPLPRALVRLLMEKATPAPAATATRSRPRATPGTPRLRRYVWSAVQGEHDNVAAAREGSRNQTLHKAAVKLGTLVGAGMLDEADAREALLAGAGAATDPLPQWEASRTIDSGLRYGIAHPRQLEDGPS